MPRILAIISALRTSWVFLPHGFLVLDMASETFTAQIKESKMAEAIKVFIVAIKSNIGCGHGERTEVEQF